MNWADYTILAVLGLSVLVGLWRGLISEVMALACWAAAFWVAWTFGDRLAEAFTSIEVPSVRLMLGYGICFIAVLIFGALVTFLVRKLVDGSGLSGTDRLLGMFFGLARGMLLVVLAVLMLGFTPFPRDAWWHESRLLPSFQNGAEWLAAKLPDTVTKHLDFKGVLERLPLPPVKPAEAPPAPAEPKKSST